MKHKILLLTLMCICTILYSSSFAYAEELLTLKYNNTDGSASNWECVAGIGLSDDGDRIKLEWTQKDKNCYWYWNNSFTPKDDTVYKIYFTINQSENIINLMSGLESFLMMPSTRADATNKLRIWNGTSSQDYTNVIYANRLYNYTFYLNTTLIGTPCEYNMTVHDVTTDSTIVTFNDFMNCHTVGMYGFKQRAINFQSQKDGDIYTTYIDDVYIHEVGEVLPSSTSDLLFSNKTEQENYKNEFSESENFYQFLNWTRDDTGAVVNDSSGICNISSYNSLIEDKSYLQNFSLCDSGCNLSFYNESFDFIEDNTTGNIQNDEIRGSVCSDDLLDPQDISVVISCGAKTIILNQTSDIIPLCSEGTAKLILETDICVNSLQVNISSNPAKNVPYNKRRIVSGLEIDRKLYVDTHLATFNETLQLWRGDHDIEYYVHGNQTIGASCSHLTESYLDFTLNESVTIVNFAPILFDPIIQTRLGQTEITDEVVIEYASGFWNFTVPYRDDDPHTINVSIYNSSELIYSFDNVSFSLSSDLFVNYYNSSSNPFSINITINDTFGDESTLNLLFNITDSSDPSCLGIADVIINNNTIYNWTSAGVVCSDENLYSVEVNCTNMFNMTHTNLNTTSYPYFNWTLISSDVVCTHEICDAHTDKDKISIKISKNVQMGDIIFDDSTTIHFNDALQNITWEKRDDSYKVCIIVKNLGDTVVYTLPDSFEEVIRTDYQGHYVSYPQRYWWDSEPFENVTMNGNVVTVDVSHLSEDKGKEKEICFDSVGKINCQIYTQHFTTRKKPANMSCKSSLVPYFKNNIEWLCFINKTGGTDDSFRCNTYVKYENKAIQINPQIEDIENIGRYESFEEENGLVNVYFKKDFVKMGFNFTYGVRCSDDEEIVVFEQDTRPQWITWDSITYRTAYWGFDNVGFIIGLVCAIVIMLAFIWWWKK